MKKSFVVIVAVMLLCVLALYAACEPIQENVDELVVYNWADYIYDYEDDFKAYYKSLTGRDIKVTYVTFDTNETMLTKILNGDSIVDVMCPSEYAIQKLLEQDMLLEMNYFGEAEDYIDTSSLNGYVHNSGNVDSQFVQKIDEVFGSVQVNGADGAKTVKMSDYFVPYMYGTLGILYNKVYFEELGIYDRETLNKANWGILFNDDGIGNMLSPSNPYSFLSFMPAASRQVGARSHRLIRLVLSDAGFTIFLPHAMRGVLIPPSYIEDFMSMPWSEK